MVQQRGRGGVAHGRGEERKARDRHLGTDRGISGPAGRKGLLRPDAELLPVGSALLLGEPAPGGAGPVHRASVAGANAGERLPAEHHQAQGVVCQPAAGLFGPVGVPKRAAGPDRFTAAAPADQTGIPAAAAGGPVPGEDQDVPAHQGVCLHGDAHQQPGAADGGVSGRPGAARVFGEGAAGVRRGAGPYRRGRCLWPDRARASAGPTSPRPSSGWRARRGCRRKSATPGVCSGSITPQWKKFSKTFPPWSARPTTTCWSRNSWRWGWKKL